APRRGGRGGWGNPREPRAPGLQKRGQGLYGDPPPGFKAIDCRLPKLLLRQRITNNLLVVPSEDALVREGRVAPDHFAAAHRRRQWLQQFRSADLLVFLRRQPGGDQLPGFGKQKEPIAILDQERCA